MSLDKLREFVVNLPSKLEFSHPAAVRQNLFKALYHAATNEGTYLKDLFPLIDDEEIESLKDYSFAITEIIERKPFFNHKQKSSYSHPADKACARSFKKGEPVYRCEQCGFDDTCVLCVHCFNKDDHVDHNVYMYLSQGDNGGICDCGDPEAFVNQLNCKCQLGDKSETDSNEISTAFAESLRETIKICLDYILDVTNFSVQTLPYIHDSINERGSKFTSKFLSDYSTLPSERYGGATDNNSDSLWYLILWNDEHHDFPSATKAIKAAVGVNYSRAHEIASDINASGRCVLRESADYTELLRYQKLAESDGLVATITSARDYMREVIVQYMFNWLVDITEFTSNIEFRELSKQYLADLLLEPGFEFAKNFPTMLISESLDSEATSEEISKKLFENGMLINGQFINYGKTSVKSSLEMAKYKSTTSGILKPDARLDKQQNSRLQFLLDFEIRLNCVIRKKLPALIIPPILANTRMKEVFCDQLVSIYPQLITSMALSDREDHLNSLCEITTQLFTCPTSVSKILRDGKAGFILGPITDIIEKHSSEWNMYTLLPNFVEIGRGHPLTYKAKKRAIIRGIRDICYLVDKNLEVNKLDYFLTHDNLVLLLLFLRNFQGYWTIERKYGEHVERELLDFVVHLEYSVPILNITKFIASCKTSNVQLVRDGVKFITDYLCLRETIWNAPGIADFRVSKQPVSFVHPVNSFLSYLLQYQGFEDLQHIFLSMKGPFVQISDVSLRSIVLGAQVKIGFWIRNGISVSRQASLYTDSLMSDLAYFRDCHLNQIAAIFDDPRATLFNFLDRWELLPWYLSEVNHDKTVYEDRFNSISEKFIVFIYNLITDRTNFIKLTAEERISHKARQAICYSLSDEPRSYSSLRSEVDIEVSELPEFDDLLNECTDYQPPTGLIDSGIYRLKSSYFEKLDPLSLYLDTSQFQTVSEYLIKNIAMEQNIKEEKVVLIPHITELENQLVNEKLAGFTKTKDFAKLMYKYLQVSIDTCDETYLPHLLHLIHAVLRDDELLHGSNYLNEQFVSIPICNLLLSVSETTMSKNVVRKAEFLLDSFISKDTRIIESLVDCFGEAYIQDYERKRSGSSKSDSEKGKRLAEERKKKVMKKFAKQRENFLAKNVEFASKDSSEEVAESSKDPKVEYRTCVLCGEPESTEELFGLLVSVTTCSSFWKLPENNTPYFSLAFQSWNDQASPSNNGIYGDGFDYHDPESQERNRSLEGRVTSTCGHGMHYNCYKTSANNLKYYPCPLCRNLCNLFVPSYLSPDNGGGLHDSDVISGLPIHNRYNQITSSSGLTKSSKIIKGLVNDEIVNQTNESVMRKLFKPVVDDFLSEIKANHPPVSSNKKKDYLDELQTSSLLIANTIRMNEIATRIGGNSSYSNFLNEIPSSSKTLMKSLIQCRAFMFENRELPFFLNSDEDLSLEYQDFWNSDKILDSVFNEVVSLFFQTDESLNTLARLGYTKLFTICIYSLLRMINEDIEYYYLLRAQQQFNLGKAEIENMETILDSYENEIEVSLGHDEMVSLINVIWFGVEKCMLPFLRQVTIFQDLLTSLSRGDNDHDSHPNFADVESKIQGQSYLDSSDVLCQKLNLPTLKELVQGIAVNEDRFNFECKIFDIVLNAKIPHYIDSGILALDYPGVVKLIDMPNDYNSCIIEYNDNSTKGVFDYIVCLSCGKKIKASKHFTHMTSCCSFTAIYFHPRMNNLKLATHIGTSPIFITVPAPYLTKHGEVKRPRNSGKAFLNNLRYQYLNKLWLNQGLYGFITRSIFGSRLQQNMGDTINIGISEDEEDIDEDEEYDDDIFLRPATNEDRAW
ncbi:DEHA2G18568p [Debaryomyces hansenii CBS767]|uniref:E3 ubiquitin-protein ligase n=1 Tax=Debaryomyces hansenii (strain ATCC 36239 / CBS 767 / BCRC 21394 / JCM 1990 / NBRC 0083 / IGC 2968) TaxID=284592 RepID=Q6BHH4_DEBHA|nr:DEHA2G18568p [Debaryomyces hansenii CBS767]CAG90854.2 DEHA2G18568p [Debaryomyces hansenii CBS767]|eukprot:XP_462347.2 DEHA2G18568p [Debaryomyces hansenii CBS767]